MYIAIVLTRQWAMPGMPCTYLAHHELESIETYLVLSSLACLQAQTIYQILAQTELQEMHSILHGIVTSQLKLTDNLQAGDCFW